MDFDLLIQQSVNGLVLACDYALFALGLSVVWGVLKVMNMAHAEFFTVGALVTAGIGTAQGWPVWFAVLVGAAGAGVVSLVVDTVAFLPLRNRNLNIEELEMASLITSLGASAVIISIAAKLTNHSLTAVGTDLFVPHIWQVGDVRVSNIQVAIVIAAVVLVIAVGLLITRTQFGRVLRAMAFSTAMAEVMGVRSSRVYRLTIVVCGVLAGLAGALLTLLVGQADAYSGDALLLKGIAIIVLAGSGSILGLLVGAAVLGFGETVGSLWLPTVIQSSLPFLILLVVLLVRPSGLFGKSEVVRI